MAGPTPKPSDPIQLETTIRTFCKDLIRTAEFGGLDVGPSAEQIHALRLQAETLLILARRHLALDHPALNLLEAASGSLLCVDGQSLEGEARFTHASRAMALRLRKRRAALGPQHADLVSELEDMGSLYELAGLRSAAWRDEALKLRDRLPVKPVEAVKPTEAPEPTKIPEPAKPPALRPDARSTTKPGQADPQKTEAKAGLEAHPGSTPSPHLDEALEADLALAVEDRYGPWLTVAETEPMLELCALLARRWLADPRPGPRTIRVLGLGLKEHAEGVWTLAARRGSESLKGDLEELLKSLDAAEIQKTKSLPRVLQLARSLDVTPLASASRAMLQCIEKEGRATWSLTERRNMKIQIGDQDAACSLIEQELEQASAQDQPILLPFLLNEALPLLVHVPQHSLLLKGSELLRQRLQVLDRPHASALQPLMRQWAEQLKASGYPEEAGLLKEQAGLLETPLPVVPNESGKAPENGASKPEAQAASESVSGAVRGTLDGTTEESSPESTVPPPVLAPTGIEASMRARLQQQVHTPATEDTREEWEALLRDAEDQLGSNHPLVAEILIARSRTGIHALEDAQRAMRILETSLDPSLRLQACQRWVECSSRDGDGREFERGLRELMTLLQSPAFKTQSFDEARTNAALGLMLFLWRERRLEELDQMPPGFWAGIEKDAKPFQARLHRTTRLQAILRAQGLP